MPLAPVPILLFDNTEGELLQLSKGYQQLRPQAVFTVCTTLDEFLAQLPKRHYAVIACLVQPDAPQWQALESYVRDHEFECPILALTPAKLEIGASERLNWLHHGFDDILDICSADKFSFAIEKARTFKEKQRQLRLKAARLDKIEQERNFLFQYTAAPAAVINQGMIVDCNDAMARFLGFDKAEDLLWNPFLDYLDTASRKIFKALAHSDHEIKKEKLTFVVDSQQVGVMVTSMPTHMDDSIGQLLTIETHQQNTNQTLQNIGDLDFLTNLYNRNFFINKVNDILQRPLDLKAQEFILFVTIDHYRQTLEEIGLAHCDELIRQVASTIQGLSPENAIIARFSEQVFTILLTDTNQQSATNLALKILRNLAAKQFCIADLELSITASIGLCLVSRSAHNAFEIMSQAHAAYEQAKRNGGNQLSIYSPEKHNTDDSIKQQIIQLEQAVASNKIYSHYYAFAALQGENQLLTTLSLSLDEQGTEKITDIPLGFQHSALVVTLDKRAATEAMRDILQAEKARITLQKDASEPVNIIVHLSAFSLQDTHFMQWLEKQCRNSDVIRRQVKFEVNVETLFTHTHHAMRFFKRFRHIGCELFIDGVGVELNAQQRQLLHRFDSSAVIINDARLEQLSSDEQCQKVQVLVHEFRQRDNWILSRSPDSADQMMTLWQLGIDYLQLDEPLSSLEEVAKFSMEMNLSA